MAVNISLNGNTSGEGFLLAPLDSTYDADLALWTDAGALAVTLQAMPNTANLVFSTAGPVNLTTAPTLVKVHSMTQSATRGDTIIQVLDGGAVVVASFTVTSLKHPVVNFGGRFEARFSTDNGYYNSNPIYSSDPLNIPVPLNYSNGWTWALEGEPTFVPAVNNVPQNLETPGMGRVIRLNNPVSLRSKANAVISTVMSITGQTSSAGAVTFTTGDPLIGQPVNFGTDTYFAGNNAPTPGDPAREEFWDAGREPLGLFEINLGNSSLYFKGASKVGPFQPMGPRGLNVRTRTPDSRPIVQGPPYISQATSTEMAQFSLTDLTTFTENRIDELISDYTNPAILPPGPSVERRNMVRRIGHLLGFLSTLNPVPSKVATVQALATPPDVFSIRIATLAQAFGPVPGWDFKEHYKGKVDTNLHAQPGGSSVIDFFRQFFSFDIEWSGFAFHSDELCGHHLGILSGDETMTGNHIGDPHTHTVNGIAYDFQPVGEFTLLRDGDYMEVQNRQTPVATANPVTDSYTGLTACVSINTAVAARVGTHRISLQPGREGKLLQFYLNGKSTGLLPEGIDLSGHRVSTFDANGETGLRIDYLDGTVVMATPAFWNTNNVWYINVSITNTKANEGIMGYVPRESWLPRLRNGESVGPMPNTLHERYVTLNKTFADSWRVTDKTSLFVYEPRTSTKTFTDTDWPAEKLPCDLKPGFQVPGIAILQGMPVEKAEIACKLVTMDDLHKHCVFDVATTGDEFFVKGYLFEQQLRQAGTKIQIRLNNLPSNPKRVPNEPGKPSTSDQPGKLVIAAKVEMLTPAALIPKGTVVFYADDNKVGISVPLDPLGNATWKVEGLEKGTHTSRAIFIPEDKTVNHGCHSTSLKYTINESLKKSDNGLNNGGNSGVNKSFVVPPWLVWILLIIILVLLLIIIF